MAQDLRAEDVARQLGKSKKMGNYFQCCCPAHDDAKPSLLVGDKAEGGIWVKCLTGCDKHQIKEDLEARQLWPRTGLRAPPGREHTKRHRARASAVESVVTPVPDCFPAPDFERLLRWSPTSLYEYRDQAGKLRSYVARLDTLDGKKEIRPIVLCRRADSNLEWIVQGHPEPRSLYGLEQLAARSEAPVLVVEGEKTADKARILFPEYVVVTWPGGTGAVIKADWSVLNGRDVSLWPDNDEPGQKAMKLIAELINGKRP